MSDLGSRLGPQGRALLHGGESQFREGDYPKATPQELDFLINDLRFPKPGTTIQTVLGYLYNYIPYIKHEHNLRLVIASFLNNPLCFGHQAPPMEQNYLILEVFKLITDKKLKISQPTLTIRNYYEVILTELTNFVSFNPTANSWKILPILSGLFLSNELRDQLYTEVSYLDYGWFFSDWDNKAKSLFKKALGLSISPSHSDNIINLSLLSFAVIFKKTENVEEYSGQVPSSFIIPKLVELIILNPEDSSAVIFKFFHLDPRDTQSMDIIQKEISQKPVIKHINKLSFLLEAYFQTLKLDSSSFEIVMDSLLKILDFNRRLCHNTQSSLFNSKGSTLDANPVHLVFWRSLKSLLFSEIIIFQGILTRFFSASRPSFFNLFGRRDLGRFESQYKQIALKILHSLYYVHFVMLSIGQGGFDSYNFVYYLTSELAHNSGIGFENLTMSLIGDYREVNLYPDVINSDYIAASKVLFVLGLWENYLQLKKANQIFIKEKIFGLAMDLADDRKYKEGDVVEAAHSVVLFCFANSTTNNTHETFAYVRLLLGQFPSRLSSHQLNIAIETLGKKLLSNPVQYLDEGYKDSAEEFIAFIYTEAEKTIPGQLIDTKQVIQSEISDPVAGSIAPEYEFAKRTTAGTSREAIIQALINLIPYFPLTHFTSWLDRIWELVKLSTPEEAEYLITTLWKALSENMDMNRVELGVRWWYEMRGMPETVKEVPARKEARL